MTVLTPDRAERTRRGVARWCATATTAHDLLEGVAERVRPIVDYDGGAWFLMDPSSVLFTDGIVEGYPEEICGDYFHNELSQADVMPFASLALRSTPGSTIHRETNGQMDACRLWREVYRPVDLDDEVRAVFRDLTGAWGAVSLARSVGRPRFSMEERDLLVGLGDSIAAGLRRIVLSDAADDDTAPDAPGLLLVGPDADVRPGTEAGARWLDRLAPPRGGATERRTALLALRELVTGSGSTERHVRIRTTDGIWVTLHAESMLDDSTLAVIVERSNPFDLAGLTSRAYGLTGREREIVIAVARGLGTNAIASTLHISTHTVRDHLKSAFAKTGVGSRAELVGVLFHDHYADRFFNRVAADHT